MTGSLLWIRCLGGAKSRVRATSLIEDIWRENIRGCQNVRYALIATNFGFAVVPLALCASAVAGRFART
jgi:hypothetical protein